MSKNLIALMLMALVIGVVACKATSRPAPVAPATGPSVADDLGSLDQTSQDVSVDGLDDLDAGLSDVENLDI